MSDNNSGRPEPRRSDIFRRWLRTESFHRLAHYALAIAVLWSVNHFSKQVQGICVPAGSYSSCQVHSILMLVILGWVAVLTYRCAAWLRTCNDDIACAIHPGMWVAVMILPFVSYFIIILIGWRMVDQIEKEAEETIPPPPDEDPAAEQPPTVR